MPKAWCKLSSIIFILLLAHQSEYFFVLLIHYPLSRFYYYPLLHLHLKSQYIQTSITCPIEYLQSIEFLYLHYYFDIDF